MKQSNNAHAHRPLKVARLGCRGYLRRVMGNVRPQCCEKEFFNPQTALRKVEVRFKFRQLEKEHALAILSWRYTPPYDYYNFDTDTIPEELNYLLDSKNAFFAILNLQGELEGYCSFGSDGQVPGGEYSSEALDIGMGIRPDLVGQGRGKQYAQAVMRYGVEQYRAQQLRVTIADFNKRAQRVWEQLGFEQVEQFVKVGSEEKFVIMARAVRSPIAVGDVECAKPNNDKSSAALHHSIGHLDLTSSLKNYMHNDLRSR